MNIKIIVLLCSLLLASASRIDLLAQPVQPDRPRTIDVKNIVLDLQFDWSKRQAHGTATVSFILLSSPDTIFLDAGMLTIHSITLSDGKPLQFVYDGGDKDGGLKIIPNRSYAPQEEITIRINYHTNWVNLTDPNLLGGSNGKGLRFFSPTSTEPERRQQLWSMGEPQSNRYWFPGIDAPDELHTTDLIATVDTSLTIIANGDRITHNANGNGTHTFHYRMNKAYPAYRTAFVIGRYVDIRQQFEGIPIHNFGYPDEAKAVEASVARLPDMMKFFSNVTGVRYPYNSYSQVFIQELPWGVGNTTIATQSENMIDDYGTHADYFYLWDGLEAEALAGQWFGNYVACKDWSDIWLNRGFARYFDGLYCEYKNGRDEYLLYNHNTFDLGWHLADWNAGIRHPVVTKDYEDVGAFTSDNYSYFRAALVLHLLRKQLGDEMWWKVIRQYLSANAGKTVTTKDFSDAVSLVSGKPMDWFFDQWIYKMGHPVFIITKQYDAAKKELLMKVRQTQTPDTTSKFPQVDYFKGYVQIEVDGLLETIWLADKPENVFSFHVPQLPKLVNFDYEGSWIKEITFEKSLDELLYQLEYDKDILGKRWAMGELVKLAGKDSTAARDKEKIYTGIRKTIAGKAYWRLRYMAIVQLQGLLLAGHPDKPLTIDPATTQLILSVIKNERSWNRTVAISFLGMTKDPKYASIYHKYLTDSSDRVINAAAIALGKTKTDMAFNTLVKLKDKPSWKNQSLISALNGLKELGDPRGVDIALAALSDLHAPRWTLATPVWDFRIAAAQTIAALGKGELGYPIISERLKQSLEENDLNDIFNNILLITTLADPRGQEAFDWVKNKFKDDANALVALQQYETQFNNSIKKN